MSHAEVFSAVSSVVPCAHMAWPEGMAPELPWAVYMVDETDDLFADNDNWAHVPRWRVELYERVRDASVERELKAALRRIGPVAVYETWIDSEKCHEVVYTFSQVERNEDEQG